MVDNPHRHSVFQPRCRDCKAVAAVACRRCGRPLCERCEPADERRCGRCEAQWSAHAAELARAQAPRRPLAQILGHVVVPSVLAAALAFAVLAFGGGEILGPMIMALALVAAVNLPLLALGSCELASDIEEIRIRARTNAARHRFLAERPPWDRAG